MRLSESFQLALFVAISSALVGCLAPGRVTPLRTEFDPSSNATCTVPLFVDDSGASVDVILGDGPSERFQIDTGAEMCALPRSMARALGLRLRSVPGTLTGATRTTWTWLQVARLERLTIGDVTFECLDAFVIDDAFLEEPLLGFRMFEDLVVTFDFPRSRLTLHRGSRDDPSCAVGDSTDTEHTIPFRLRGHLPEVEFDLDGEMLRAVLDTGYEETLFLPSSFEQSIRLESPPRAIQRTRTINDRVLTRSARASGDLCLAGEILRRPTVSFGSNAPLLGFAAVRSFALTFDLPRRTLHVRRAGAPAGVSLGPYRFRE